jgi:hypothetical protein
VDNPSELLAITDLPPTKAAEMRRRLARIAAWELAEHGSNLTDDQRAFLRQVVARGSK